MKEHEARQVRALLDGAVAPKSTCLYVAQDYARARWECLMPVAGTMDGVTFRASDLTVRFENGSVIRIEHLDHGPERPGDRLRGLEITGPLCIDECVNIPDEALAFIKSRQRRGS